MLDCFIMYIRCTLIFKYFTPLLAIRTSHTSTETHIIPPADPIGRSPADTLGSNPAGKMEVCLL